MSKNSKSQNLEQRSVLAPLEHLETHRAAINICEICGRYKFRMASRRSHGVSVSSVHSVRELLSVREKKLREKTHHTKRKNHSPHKNTAS